MFRSLKNQYYWQFIILLAFCFVTFFYGMASYPILDMNEGLYAEIAREMLVTKDYIIPHLNYVPYLEKPPLLYWLLASSYQIFGISPFAARLIPSLSSLATIFVILFFAQKLNLKQTGWITAIILASSFGFVLIGRVVFFDMLLTFLLTAALVSFYLWYKKENNKFLYWFYTTLALAFLTKGMLPIVIAGSTVLVFLLLTKTSVKKFLKVFNPLGILIFFLLTAPWYITAAIKLHNFSWDYFINEQFFRFLGKREPYDYHSGPMYFYIPRILAYLFPWCFLIPTLFKRWQGKINQQDPLKIFLYSWFFVALIIFSLSFAKGDYYMVLGVPPLAMLLAMKFENFIAASNNKILALLFIINELLIIAAILYIFINKIIPTPPLTKLPILLAFLAIYSLLGCFLIYRYQKPLLAFILTAGLMMPILMFAANFERDMQADYNQLVLTDYIKAHDPNRPVYLFQDYEGISTVLFNLERRLPIIHSRSQDLYFGSKTKEATGWFLTDSEFLQKLNQPVYVILLKNKLADFKHLIRKKSFTVVASSEKAILIIQQ